MFVNNQLQIKETLGSCGIFAAILMTQCRCQFLALPIAAIFGGLQIINNLCQNGVFHKQAKKSHYQNPYFLPSPVHLQDSQRWSSSFFRVSASFDVHG